MNNIVMDLLRRLADGEGPRQRLVAEILAEVGLIANTPAAKLGWSGCNEFRPYIQDIPSKEDKWIGNQG